MSVTMADIAKAAECSVTTVGRVLHNNGYVRQDVRERIEKVIVELGYVPNQSARALKSNRSGIIGVLVMQNYNGLYYRISESIIDAAHKNGFECITMEVQRQAQDARRAVQSFIGLRVDALVIVSNSKVTAEMFQHLKRAGIPVVAVERGYFEQPIDHVIVQDYEAAYNAVNGIARKGHSRIALIAKESREEVEKQRLAGYKQAIADNSHLLDEELVCLMSEYSVAQGRAAAERLLAMENPPTAIFATADTFAAGVLQAMYERNLRVPEDVSLVGYDDVLSRSLSPAIDSVALLLEDTGAQVVDLLIKRMAKPDRPVEVRPIYTRYMDRGSVSDRSKS